jgi:hypothetical protein
MGRGQQSDDFAAVFGRRRGLRGQMAAQAQEADAQAHEAARRAAMSGIWEGTLNDEDYLALAAELPVRRVSQSSKATGLNFVLDSRSLWVPNSPQQKQYCGHIALRRAPDGSYSFCGLTTFGGSNNPHGQVSVLVESSRSLSACISAVNAKLADKQSGGGSSVYEPMSGMGFVRIDRTDFDRAFRAAAGN